VYSLSRLSDQTQTKLLDPRKKFGNFAGAGLTDED
jgi:hypothetical protein